MSHFPQHQPNIAMTDRLASVNKIGLLGNTNLNKHSVSIKKFTNHTVSKNQSNNQILNHNNFSIIDSKGWKIKNSLFDSIIFSNNNENINTNNNINSKIELNLANT
jgi:hypothetical protein